MTRSVTRTGKIKVIFLANKLGGGGAERSLLEVVKSLDRSRYDTELWRLSSENFYPDYLDDLNKSEVLPSFERSQKSTLRIKRCNSSLPRYLSSAGASRFIIDGLRLYDRLRHLLKITKYTPILVSSQLSMNACASVLQWLCSYRVPVIFIEQNEPYWRYTFGEPSHLRDLALTKIRNLYPRANHVIAVSRATKLSLVARFGIDCNRITVIPNPVDIKRVQLHLNQPPPEHPFYKGRAPILLCTARFSSQKNHQLLLRSFALVRTRIPAKLILLGHGEFREMIKRSIQEMNLVNDVAIIDFQHNPFSYVAHSSLSLLSSYCEGHPLALLESLACGIPVVSTNWKGATEIVRHGVNGIISKMTDQAFADGIMAGLNLSRISSTRLAAITTATKFDISRITGKYENMLLAVAKSNGIEPVRL